MFTPSYPVLDDAGTRHGQTGPGVAGAGAGRGAHGEDRGSIVHI